MKAFQIVNCADHISAKSWNFLEDEIKDLDINWLFVRNSPTKLEKIVKLSKLARYRACLEAVWQAKQTKADLIITHLPRATCWTAIFAKLLNVDIPHLAFSFNFTDLPAGTYREIMSRSFQQVDRFVVYSTCEKSLYAEYFGIEPERIDTVLWAMNQPSYNPQQSIMSEEYICAVGGEGRDYKTLAEAMAKLPDIKLVIVARGASVAGLEFSSNVRVLTDIPVDEFWNVVRFSKFVVLPLKNEQTNCSHISLVGSMLFGKPILTTRSTGTEDYVVHNGNALIIPPKDVEALSQNITRLWTDSNLAAKLGEASQSMAVSKHQLSNWVDYLKKY